MIYCMKKRRPSDKLTGFVAKYTRVPPPHIPCGKKYSCFSLRVSQVRASQFESYTSTHDYDGRGEQERDGED